MDDHSLPSAQLSSEDLEANRTFIYSIDSDSPRIRRLPPLLRSSARLPAGLPEHWEVRYELAPSTMGEVFVVLDQRLKRELVVKLVRPGSDPRAFLRFDLERQLTARLDHAGIVTVIDTGQLTDGRLWFALRFVRGITLEEALQRWFQRTPDAMDLDRLLVVLQRVCEIVGDAHGQGVVHRDLKPDNVVLDTRGDAFVLDWGLARASGLSADGNTTVLGTPQFMPPEQAEGRVADHGPQSDVYALGGILYYLLCGRPPHPGGIPAVLAGPPPPVTEIAARRGWEVPPGLAYICHYAMEREIRDRPNNGLRLAALIQSWREGNRRRADARVLLDSARLEEASARTLVSEAQRLRDQANTLLRTLRPYDEEELKRPVWELQAQADDVLADAERHWASFDHQVGAALALDPSLDEAHDLLADRRLDQLLTAESSGDGPAAARAEYFLEQHARGPRRSWLRAEGRLTLLCPPARVEVERFEHKFGRLIPVRVPELDFDAPVEEQVLPVGSWRLHIMGGPRPVLYPVRIQRGQHWVARAPEGDVPPVLLDPGPLAPDDLYVPAGPFQVGGDPVAPDSMPGRSLWVDGFVIRRFPVTVREYLDFLDATCPTLRENGPVMRGPAGHRYAPRQDGHVPQDDWPAVCVSWLEASSFAAWEASRTGLPWRLPDEVEWEKAARGVDGRIFPWGDRHDPSWGCSVHSHRARPTIASIHTYPVDESPYGVRGMGGNVREWCFNRYRRLGLPIDVPRPRYEDIDGDPAYRMIRGGSFSDADNTCRNAARFAAGPTVAILQVGFRLVRSLVEVSNQDNAAPQGA